MQAYPHYKDSGLPWMGRIPVHWQTAHLRYVARIGNGTTPSRDRADYWENGTVPWLNSGQVNDYIVRQARQFITPAAQQAASLRLWPKGSVIVGMIGQGKTRGMSAYLDVSSTINQNLAGITSKEEINGVFLHYTLIAAYDFLRKYGRGGNQAALNCSIIGNFSVLLPPPPEQSKIATYLRSQDAKIARFIRIKRELIEKLKEQKLRLIDHAVTGGLDTSGKRKPSGVAWLGEVPGHWDVLRLKNIADVVLGKMLTTQQKGNDQLRPYLRSKNVQWSNPDVSDINTMWFSDAEMQQLRIRKNDILVSEGGEVGRACMWNEELPECYIQNSVHRVSAKPIILPKFLFYQFLVYGKHGRFNAIVNRVSIAHLTREKLVTIPFTVPPLEEQKTILAHIAQQTAPLTAAITQAEAEITLIREYRERLILDAVTGQIDLRGWQGVADEPLADDSLADLADDDGQEVEEDISHENT